MLFSRLRSALRSKARLEEQEYSLDLMYRTLLGREPRAAEKAECLRKIGAETRFPLLFKEVADSQEARDFRASKDESASRGSLIDDLAVSLVETVFDHYLRRSPSAEDKAGWATALKDGLSSAEFLRQVRNSSESLRINAGSELSDGEFLLKAGPILFGRGLGTREIVALQQHLGESQSRRMEFVLQQLMSRLQPEPAPDVSRSWIMGTETFLTREIWERRREEVKKEFAERGSDPKRHAFHHQGVYKASLIASMYKGEKYIEKFLRNICSQSIFDQCELIIIDANSPENESAAIKRYQDDYPNIVYKRFDTRIGIYDAWNEAVGIARGRYLTNTNLDDLRRHDSIELQVDFLDGNPQIDVVYQDTYYSFDPNLSFEEVALFGFKTDMPIVTPANLMYFNSPHNAPMWRKDLHAKVGLFDTAFQSGGDWEFWCRCLVNDARFGKINAPHVVYFHNPEGISTRPDTRGFEEVAQITKMYSARLASPLLLMSRQDFCDHIGLPYGADEARLNLSHYDLAQKRLSGLASHHEPGAPARRGPETDAIKVLVDGVCFQTSDMTARDLWSDLIPALAADDGFELHVLQRGGSPDVKNVRSIAFPSRHPRWTPADSLLIQEKCDEHAIDVFISTEFTTAIRTPQVHLLREMVPRHAPTGRIFKEMELALAFSRYIACASTDVRQQLLRQYPDIAAARVSLVHETDDAEGPPSTVSSLERERTSECLARLIRLAGAERTRGNPTPFYDAWQRARLAQAAVDGGYD